jgi:hypothetical protein
MEIASITGGWKPTFLRRAQDGIDVPASLCGRISHGFTRMDTDKPLFSIRVHLCPSVANPFFESLDWAGMPLPKFGF